MCRGDWYTLLTAKKHAFAGLRVVIFLGVCPRTYAHNL